MSRGAIDGRRRYARRGAVIGVGAAAVAAVCTASASAVTGSDAAVTLRLTARAAATAFITPCPKCVASVPAGIRTGAVAEQYGRLVGAGRGRVGHYALLATQVTPQGELLVDVTLVLRDGQITAHGVEEPPANGGVIAVTGGTGRYRAARGVLRFEDRSATVTRLQVDFAQ